MEKKIQVKCIKDVVMNYDNRTAFIKGKIYNGYEKEGFQVCLENEYGNKFHYVSNFNGADTDYSDFFKERFMIVETVKRDIPESVRELLEEEQQMLRDEIKHLEYEIKEREAFLQGQKDKLNKKKQKLEDVNQVLGK